MEGTERLIATLKLALKEKKLTYGEVATGLDMSEANVKRMFSANRITIDRVEAICRLLEMELSDLFNMYEDSRKKISHLTVEQEQELVADTKLLFAAVCVRNHLSFQDIISHYSVEESELIQSLAKLDRIKIIDLLPNNRIKLRVAENFHWIPHGPIEKFYEKNIEREFLKGGFDHTDNPRMFFSGLVSENSRVILLESMKSLSDEFHQLQKRDSELPIDKRINIGVLVALREWEFKLLERYGK